MSNDTAFTAALECLQEAQDAHLKSMRVMTSVLLTVGITPDIAETILGPVDELEEAQQTLRASLLLLKESTA